ncbi:bifunctional aspartate kinase/homoserine dehydrogenase II [Cognaticolwellia mytili]|uniref:bifunctional aspartate kinase/homoserine dehydrogenase II n=1 Tax=Cognaticolwellia mytili TaxID=1888913 RepID=UPI000A178615|nr:bifunctional aspartate kinase/homoserine dehydrogenase II [Cognaticolwellia mytili]
MIDSNVAVKLTPSKNQLAKTACNVHKFGGSSLATAACIERVVDIIRQHCQLNDIIVVSANGDTTDALFSIYQIAFELDEVKQLNIEQVSQSSKVSVLEEQLSNAITELEVNQGNLIAALLNASSAARLQSLLSDDIEEISQHLPANPERYQNDFLAFGEVWSARLLSAVLSESVCPSYMLDARDFLLLENEKSCAIDYVVSEKNFTNLQQPEQLVVVTGYIARNQHQQACTLGRNGSDYSATIMAALSGARNVTLWTDVDGIYSADPRVVPQARKLHRLPNAVANELGRLGNPVLHAKTLHPLTSHNTHLHVASSFAPEVSGSEIGKFGQIAKQELSVTYLNDLILAKSVSLQGEWGSRAIKEFSPVCYNLDEGYVVITQVQQKALSQWLASHDTEVSFKPVAIIAAVGYQVAKQGGMRARFKRALRHHRTLHFAHAENQHSYIAVLPELCTGELLNNIHADMTKDARNIALVVAGLGNIGQRFLEILPKQLARLPTLENVHLVGLIGSSKALINTDGIEVTKAITSYQQQAKAYESEQLVEWLTNHPYDELVVVDITPSEDFSQLYQQFFAQGIHVIGANKWAASSSTENYQQLLNTAKANNSLWLGNTTVGAGLPINSSIEELINSGDVISEISGIFSGTLSWLFQYYDGLTPFSELLANALEQGITEPDPREDLSGRDVQRKLLILARAAGFELSLADIDCQSLVPEQLRDIPLAEFLQRTDELNDLFLLRLSAAKEQACGIRYVARFVSENGKVSAKVSLEKLANDDAFSQLTPCDNVFQIKSEWYQENPLIIRGPGAGRDVTAGGIHADLVTVCQQLSHRQQQVKIKGLN